jgi:hypothetical protein
MSLSLLLDENLSEKLLPLLFDRFPDSRHVRLIGLGGADDLAIWDRAHRQRQRSCNGLAAAQSWSEALNFRSVPFPWLG